MQQHKEVWADFALHTTLVLRKVSTPGRWAPLLEVLPLLLLVPALRLSCDGKEQLVKE